MVHVLPSPSYKLAVTLLCVHLSILTFMYVIVFGGQFEWSSVPKYTETVIPYEMVPESSQFSPDAFVIFIVNVNGNGKVKVVCSRFALFAARPSFLMICPLHFHFLFSHSLLYFASSSFSSLSIDP